jgi:tetratricopeptide (TPR) repeat protein
MKKKPERTRSHPLFGEIPLVRVPYKTAGGREDGYWTYDLTYKPPLPKGAVAGDVTRQDYCTMCNVPKYFYVDEARTCVECGEAFTFWAKEQKFWYEDLHFNCHSQAIRCLECRKARRDSLTLQKAYAQAVRLAASKPGDPGALLLLCEATVATAEKSGTGDLDRALAAARKARKLDAALHEALYWEGAVQAAAGRPEKAREAYGRFIEAGRKVARLKTLVKTAEKRRRGLAEPEP